MVLVVVGTVVRSMVRYSVVDLVFTMSMYRHGRDIDDRHRKASEPRSFKLSWRGHGGSRRHWRVW